MMFQRKLDGAMEKLHENSEAEKAEQTTGKEEQPKLEKNDALAMLLAAVITILPVAFLVLGGIALLGWFFLMR